MTRNGPAPSLEESLAQWHRAHGELVTDQLAWLVVRSLGLGGEPAELTEAMVCEVLVCEACRELGKHRGDGLCGCGPPGYMSGDPDCPRCEGSGRCQPCGGEGFVTKLRPAIVRGDGIP